MRVVLISVSKAPGRQCASDASPAVWDHTVLPATRYRWTRPWEESQTSAYYCCNLPGSEAGTNLYCLVNRGTYVWTTCSKSLPGSAPGWSRTCNLSVTSSARYRYTTKPHEWLVEKTKLKLKQKFARVSVGIMLLLSWPCCYVAWDDWLPFSCSDHLLLQEFLSRRPITLIKIIRSTNQLSDDTL